MQHGDSEHENAHQSDAYRSDAQHGYTKVVHFAGLS
jgi:hypothetical protein